LASALTGSPSGSTVSAVGSWQTYQRASAPVPAEVSDLELRCAEGEVPRDLEGVLFRNGPGTNASHGVPYLHPFDGDGHVVRFAFEGGRVRYRNRFVETRERARERALGRPAYRSFGTNLPGGLRANALRLRFKNAANTSVVHHGGALLALWEGGLPHRLDPRTLETLAREDFGGKLQNRFSRLEHLLAPELPFSAHPKIDPDTGELFNFGTLLGRTPRLLLYRAAKSGALDPPESIALDRLVFLHDFALTRRYRVFFLVPVAFRVATALSGLAPPAEALEALRDQPTQILLVPRDGGPHVKLEASPCFLFHFAFAHDEEDGRVTVVGMRMPEFPSARVTREVLDGRAKGSMFPSAVPTRYVLDPAACTVLEERLSDRPAELPTVHRTSFAEAPACFWSIAGEPGDPDPFQDKVQRFDLSGGPGALRDFSPDIPGEPLFVPPRHVLTLVYRAREHRSDLYVLDAGDLSTVARLELPHHVPPGFHGTWVPAG
jgi:all-trans-8'-apo-beta-carotenal 15,15'-oxygenase